MASTTQDELYRTFLDISGQQTPAIVDVNAMLANVIAEVRDVRNSVPAPVVKTQSTPQATSGSGGVTAGSVASTVLTSGFGLVPLISGLIGLFSGGGAPAPPPLVKYALPASIDFQAAESRAGVGSLGYDQMGMPRSYSPPGYSPQSYSPQSYSPQGDLRPSYPPQNYSPQGDLLPGYPTQNYPQAASNGGPNIPTASAAPQITVNVQAMDARSFLDRSNDIALAVRDAMLNLNAINDVVNEL